MRRTFIYILALVLLYMHGVAVGAYKIFPYEQMKTVKAMLWPAPKPSAVRDWDTLPGEGKYIVSRGPFLGSDTSLVPKGTIDEVFERPGDFAFVRGGTTTEHVNIYFMNYISEANLNSLYPNLYKAPFDTDTIFVRSLCNGMSRQISCWADKVEKQVFIKELTTVFKEAELIAGLRNYKSVCIFGNSRMGLVSVLMADFLKTDLNDINLVLVSPVLKFTDLWEFQEKDIRTDIPLNLELLRNTRIVGSTSDIDTRVNEKNLKNLIGSLNSARNQLFIDYVADSHQSYVPKEMQAVVGDMCKLEN